ncbi:hypothetical protein JW835_06885 [bacterium]|nr:hypothetical protein [bacterium]
MYKITEKPLHTDPLTFTDDLYITIHSHKDIVFTENPDHSHSVLASIIKNDRSVYLFKDSRLSGFDILVNGQKVFSFTPLPVNCNISVCHQDKIHDFSFEYTEDRKKTASTSYCPYCWLPFEKNEQVICIKGDEFHEWCAEKIQEFNIKKTH